MENEHDELEAAGPSRRGPASLLVTLVGLGLCLYLLAEQRQALAYWFSSAEPIELGGPERFQTEAAEDNRPARITGTAGKSTVRYELFGTHYEIVAIPGTNVLVRRTQAHALPIRPGESLPPPSGEQFTATGRLLADSSAPDYANAFRTFVEVGETVPQKGKLFILFEGDMPRSGWRTPAFGALLAAVALINVVGLLRYARSRRSQE